MPGSAVTNPSIEEIVDRLHSLHPRLIDLSLGRLQALLARLGHPDRRLPPVIHVAGTNGKGSTCAFLRSIAEAAGMRVHVYTSPHLVHFNERIRLAGTLVSNARLAAALEHVERVNDGAPITVFEVITAVALYLFAEEPADLCILEVGLGGRGDATNVIETPAASVITSISIDHSVWLGDTLALIAAEKAGIIKPGVPVILAEQTEEAAQSVLSRARDVGAPVLRQGLDWMIADTGDGLRFQDEDAAVDLPYPALPGRHQIGNAGNAIAALRAAGLAVPDAAIRQGLRTATWPARLHRLTGRLTGHVPPDWEIWLDGGHNPGAGIVLADHVARWSDCPLHLIVGMKQSKDARNFLTPLLPHATSLWAVAEPGQHMAQLTEEIVAASDGRANAIESVADALQRLADPAAPARVLICGSLYLAGQVLKADGEAVV